MSTDKAIGKQIAQLAQKHLQKRGSAEKALKSFAADIWRDNKMVRYVLLPFLQSAENSLRAEGPESFVSSDHSGNANRTQSFGGVEGHSPYDSRKTSIVHVPSSPSPSRLRAALKVERQSAQTIFDTYKIYGKPLGDYTVAEAIGVGKHDLRHGYVLLNCARIVANADQESKLRDVAKLGEVERIIQKAADFSDAA